MAAGFFSPDGANAVTVRPTAVDPALPEGWMKDVSHLGAGDGTVVTASLLNQIIANLRTFVTELGGAADGGDDMLLTAAQAGLLEKATYDPTNVAGDVFALDNMVEGVSTRVMTDTERTKLAYLTVNGAIDLDTIADRVLALDAIVVLRGEWDASTGSFPDGTANPTLATEAGDSYIVTGAGTVDGVAFSIGDRLLAISDGASTTTYAANWLSLDYTDNWDSPALTGTPTAPTPTTGDDSTKIATTAFVQTSIDPATYTEKTYIVDDDVLLIGDSEDSGNLKRLKRSAFPSSYSFKNIPSDVAGQNVATAQPWFPVTGAVAVEANVTYRFEGFLHLSRSAGTTSHTTSLLFGGTATVSSIRGMAWCKTGDASSYAADNSVLIDVVTAVQVKAASTSATEQTIIHVTGTVRFSSAGTFIPQFQYSATPGAVPTVKANTFFELSKIGADTIVSAGTWS